MNWADLFDRIAAATTSQDPGLRGSVMTKAVVITEWQQPDGTRSLVHVTMDGADGQLKPWEIAGLLTTVLARTIRRNPSQ